MYVQTVKKKDSWRIKDKQKSLMRIFRENECLFFMNILVLWICLGLCIDKYESISLNAGKSKRKMVFEDVRDRMHGIRI